MLIAGYLDLILNFMAGCSGNQPPLLYWQLFPPAE